MKTIIIALILLCSIAAAEPHIIAVLVWDESGNLEADVPIAFTFENQSHTSYTATDGSCCFDCQNFEHCFPIK